MRRKEQIIEVLKKHIGECAISGDDADYLLFHLTKDILSLPIDVPSEEEIEEFIISHPDNTGNFILGAGISAGFKVGSKWAISEILKRNGNLSL
jgi:hypothetical protein